MLSLHLTILAVMLTLAPPGRSAYSVVAVPECGTDQLEPTCRLERLCDAQTTACLPPRWSREHHAFVRQENAEEARERYSLIAQAIAKVASAASSPTETDDGKKAPPLWRWSAQDLAFGLGSIAFHESGYRRDIHEGVGDAALGDCSYRSAAGLPITRASAVAQRKAGKTVRRYCRSVCLVQINLGGLDGEKFGVRGRELVGLDSSSTERCLLTGARVLAAARERCSRWQPAGAWFRPAIVSYGSGNGCASSESWVTERVKTYRLFTSAPPPPAGALDPGPQAASAPAPGL